MNPWLIIALYTAMFTAFNNYVENRHPLKNDLRVRERAAYGKGYVKRIYRYRKRRMNPETWDDYNSTKFKQYKK